MRLFIVSVLLAATSTSALAAQALGKETLIITSSPAPCQEMSCLKDDKATRTDNIKKQYAWINQYKPEGRQLAGVVIPGNLTESGTSNEAIEQLELFKLFTTPYYYGLGPNDYINNKENNIAGALWQVKWFKDHMESVKNKSGLFKESGNLYFDFIHSHVGSTDGWAYEDGIGSMGYAIELGAKKNIYLIQLNANTRQDKVVLKGDLGIREETFTINPIIEWLQNRLEYAAQFSEIYPGSPPKTIVVSMTGTSVDPQIVDLLNRYDANLRFLSNDGSSANCRKPDNPGDTTKFFCLGFSIAKEVLELEIDFDRHNFTVFNRQIEPDQQTKIISSLFYDPKPKLDIGTSYPQAKVVMFSHKGWYDYVAKVSYLGTDNAEKVLADSGRKNANTSFTVEVPKEISNVTVSFEYMPGHVEVLNQDIRKDLASNMICVATNGYAGKISRQKHNKVILSNRDTGVNFCDYPW